MVCDDGNEGTFDDACVSGVCTGNFRVVQIAPIVMANPSLNPRFPGPDPPTSAEVIDPETTFYIELWATNDAAPMGGLACVHVDLNYDRTNLVDSVAPAEAAALFPLTIVDEVFDDHADLAAYIAEELARSRRGVLVVNPVPAEAEISRDDWERWIERAMDQTRRESGRSLTPAVLRKLHEVSDGRTLDANLALVRANTELAASLCRAMLDASM